MYVSAARTVLTDPPPEIWRFKLRRSSARSGSAAVTLVGSSPRRRQSNERYRRAQFPADLSGWNAARRQDGWENQRAFACPTRKRRATGMVYPINRYVAIVWLSNMSEITPSNSPGELVPAMPGQFSPGANHGRQERTTVPCQRNWPRHERRFRAARARVYATVT